MVIGIPVERNPTEHRVAISPSGARALVHQGQRVVVESGAGEGARFTDEEYRDAGVELVYGPDEVFGRADLLVKVAALQPVESALLRDGQIVLGFHHPVTSRRERLADLLRRGVTLIGLEVIEDRQGDLPVLHAMSEIAGQLSVHVAAHELETISGGRGILLGGGPAIPAAHVVILGAGVVGRWAARAALGTGAQVTLLDTSLDALRRAEEALERRPITELAHPHAVNRAVGYADVLIGAVLQRGRRTPHVVDRDMVGAMKRGAVIVDVSIDQGGCIETSRPTTLADPVYVESGIKHYAVPNMASAVARTASLALTSASLPLVQSLAARGLPDALEETPGLSAGLYSYRGDLVSPTVAAFFGIDPQRLPERSRGSVLVGAAQTIDRGCR